MKDAITCSLVAPLFAACAWSQTVTSPEAHLGRKPGADFALADWKEVSSWYDTLDRQSERVKVERAGKTTEGREFLAAIVSSERNMARLDAIRAAAAKLADPRGLDAAARVKVLADAVPILMISNAMHSTETAAPQFGMEFTHELATSDAEPWKSARERLVVVVLPCTNPDGLDHVCEWYRSVVGTPYETAGLTRLYQHYAGHDNNRDWFALSLEETRIVTHLLYDVWHPQVYWDVHQQGQNAERMFVPPFRDPLDPNLDPNVMMGINLLGTRAMADMTREGFSGVASGVTFDQWWNGGNRNVPVRHNIVGLLTEAASVNFASPVFLERSKLRAPGGKGAYAPGVNFPMPWPGGWWHLRDIIEYELAFGRSLLRSLASEPRMWLECTLAASERSIAAGRNDSPRAWVIPSDNEDRGATRRLVDTLLQGGVEIHSAKADFTVDGRAYGAGSLVILREQPYGQHVKDLFEVQRYPDGDPPYDVAGWTLPMLFGVRRVECVEKPAVELARLANAREIESAFGARPLDGWVSSESDDWMGVFGALSVGKSLRFEFDSGRFREGPIKDEHEELWLGRMPRVGLYAPWTGSMDEGWMRWVFDTWKLPFVTVRNEALRAGDLREWIDVLVIPDVRGETLDQGRAAGTAPSEFTGGLDPEGAAIVEEFVRGGGKLVTVGASSAWAIELFDLPLVDVTKEKKKDGAAEFSCPGSVLRGVPESALTTRGLPESMALFFSNSAAWRVEKPKSESEGESRRRPIRTLMRYAPTRTLLSGWIRSPETIEGQAAWVAASHGAGAVHLFGFSPQYRGWSQQTFQLLFRAILFDGTR